MSIADKACDFRKMGVFNKAFEIAVIDPFVSYSFITRLNHIFDNKYTVESMYTCISI